MEELNRMNPDEYKTAGKIDICVVLDNIRSQNNIGSVFRTCDAFRINKLYLCGICSTPPHREIQKTALGASETVNWEYFPDTLEAVKILKSQGYKIISVEQVKGSTMLHEQALNPEVKTALIFGHEVRGVDQTVIDESDYCLEIPQFGTKHSLNIAVSAGIVLWELIRTRISRI